MTQTQLHYHAHGQTAYRHYINNPQAPTVFYLAGHKNVLDHHKSDLLRDICAELGLNLLHFAYAGWDDSVFNDVPLEAEGYVQHWLEQALDLFDTILGYNKTPCIIAGYSMGAYLALALANARPQHVCGVIGLASGFGQNLVAQIREIYGTYNISNTDSGFECEPCANSSVKILTPLTAITCPVVLNHAADDALVNPENMAHIATACPHALVKPTLMATGAHRLNEPQHIEWLATQLQTLSLQN